MFKGKEEKEREERQKREAAAQERQRKQQEHDRAKQAQQQKIEKFFSDYRSLVRSTVESGSSAHLFKEIYVPVDAQMNELGPASGLYLSQVNYWGRAGWEVISVIPRTYGGYQVYKVTKSTAYGVSGWGKDTHQAGLGGHVVGVYVLMQYTVTRDNFEKSLQVIDEVAKEDMPEELTKRLQDPSAVW